MDKAYSKIIFINNQTPALNDQNLNRISQALDEIDNRVIELDSRVTVLEEKGGSAGGTTSGEITVTQDANEFTITIQDGALVSQDQYGFTITI